MMAELADHQLPGAVRRSVPMAGPVCTVVLGVISSCPGQTSLLLPFFNFVSSTSLLNLFLLVARWASITILQQKSGSIYCLSLLGKNYFLQTWDYQRFPPKPPQWPLRAIHLLFLCLQSCFPNSVLHLWGWTLSLLLPVDAPRKNGLQIRRWKAPGSVSDKAAVPLFLKVAAGRRG